MIIENWFILSNYSPYQAPELRSCQLHGFVFGHPRFENGAEVTTSEIRGIFKDLIVTKSGSKYTLGNPSVEYEMKFPNSKQRLINWLKDKQ